MLGVELWGIVISAHNEWTDTYRGTIFLTDDGILGYVASEPRWEDLFQNVTKECHQGTHKQGRKDHRSTNRPRRLDS